MAAEHPIRSRHPWRRLPPAPSRLVQPVYVLDKQQLVQTAALELGQRG